MAEQKIALKVAMMKEDIKSKLEQQEYVVGSEVYFETKRNLQHLRKQFVLGQDV